MGSFQNPEGTAFIPSVGTSVVDTVTQVNMNSATNQTIDSDKNINRNSRILPGSYNQPIIDPGQEGGTATPQPAITSAISATSLVSGSTYAIDTTSSAFNQPLPPAPIDGFNITFIDVSGTWGTNPLTVTPVAPDQIVDPNLIGFSGMLPAPGVGVSLDKVRARVTAQYIAARKLWTTF